MAEKKKNPYDIPEHAAAKFSPIAHSDHPPDYKPLPLVGGIKEKGFSSSLVSPVSEPELKVLSFPVARHRSEGPHWAPLNTQAEVETEEAEEEKDVEAAALHAKPLVRKPKKGLQLNWRDLDSKKIESENVDQSENQINTEDKTVNLQTKEHRGDVKLPHGALTCTDGFKHGTEDNSKHTAVATYTDGLGRDHTKNNSGHTGITGAGSKGMEEHDKSSRRVHFDMENRTKVLAMSEAEVADMQAELSERFNPEVLEMLKKRGAEKERKRAMEKRKFDTSSQASATDKMSEVENAPLPSNDLVSIHGQASEIQEISEKGISTKNNWVQRVEAVKFMKFDLQGDLLLQDNQEPSPIFQSVSERDFLRTEGDPARAGYTLVELTELVRSTVPGQRALALRALTLVLANAAVGLKSQEYGGCSSPGKNVDWQAVWAYALGPQPQLVLALRLALDDTHATVILTCAQALQELLTIAFNESFYNLLEVLGSDGMFSAPIFRRKTKMEEGFIGGGRWKYNVKPIQMCPASDKAGAEEGNSTVGDDASVAANDAAAGLIRMGVLSRIRYILEVEQIVGAEEPLLTVLIFLARHSPKAAEAIMNCPRLIDVIVQKFLINDESCPARARAIQLLKVLCQVSYKNCIYFAEFGTLQVAESDLFKSNHHLLSGDIRQESIKGQASTFIRAIRLWRACICHRIGISLFSDFYPALCFWLTPPSSVTTSDNKGKESFEVAQECYTLLGSLAKTLPLLHGSKESKENVKNNQHHYWPWSIAIPLVENCFGWFSPECISTILKDGDFADKNLHISTETLLVTKAFMGTLSSVMRFLSAVCERILPEETGEPNAGSLEWLPVFVPTLGLSLVKSGLLNFYAEGSTFSNSLVYYLSHLTLDVEHRISVVQCLHATICLAKTLDRLLTCSNMGRKISAKLTVEEQVLHEGLIQRSGGDLRSLLGFLNVEVVKERAMVCFDESNSRGGPAPGVGFGWGCKGGGIWSGHLLLVQAYAALVLDLYGVLPVNVPPLPSLEARGGAYIYDAAERIDVGLTIIAISSPRKRNFVHRVFKEILLSYDNLSLLLSGMEPVDIEKSRRVLLHYFTKTWLTRKSKKKAVNTVSLEKSEKMTTFNLPTVDEEDELYNAKDSIHHEDTLLTEWAGTRLPLPAHWLLSPLAGYTAQPENNVGPVEITKEEVIRAGISLLLGLERMFPSQTSNFSSIPVIRKVHALSTIFLLGGDIYLESTSKIQLVELQDIYGSKIDDILSERNLTVDATEMQSLDFEASIDSTYPIFAEKVAEQYASVSYGDITFGRQIAIYLIRSTAEPIWLAVWNVLAAAHILELLPTLEACCCSSSSYLDPMEDREKILEAYLSAWVNGALNRAAKNHSLSFSLAIHHLSRFLFVEKQKDSVRMTFARKLLRSAARNSQLQDMMAQLIEYQVNGKSQTLAQRLEFLNQASGGERVLLDQLEHLARQILTN